jgi:hypothetical protein
VLGTSMRITQVAKCFVKFCCQSMLIYAKGSRSLQLYEGRFSYGDVPVGFKSDFEEEALDPVVITFLIGALGSPTDAVFGEAVLCWTIHNPVVNSCLIGPVQQM